MPQNIKVFAEEKVCIVASYLGGQYGYYGVTFLGRWVCQYQSQGCTVFIPNEHCTNFSLEIKQVAVEESICK